MQKGFYRLVAFSSLLCCFGAWSCAKPPTAPVASSGEPQHPKRTRANIVNGVAYQAAADTLWSLPAPGAETIVWLELELTNHRTHDYRMDAEPSFRVRLTSADGKVLPFVGKTPRPTSFTLVKPGLSNSVFSLASLTWNGKLLRLSGEDLHGNPWHVEGLQAGKYSLELEYEKVKTPALVIEITPRKISPQTREIEEE